MPLLTSLLILIVSARLMGNLFDRLGQPSIVGEMLAGVILGPSIFNIIHANEALHGISELAVFFVILSAGLEMNFKEVADVIRGRGIIIAILGFIIPLFAGIGVGMVFELDVMKTVFLGLCVSITALPVAVRILGSFNLIDSDIARYSVATAIVNDLSALLVLGVILSLPEQKTFESIGLSVLFTGGKLLLLGIFILGFNWTLERIQQKGIHVEKIPENLIKVFGPEALFGLVALFVLVFASVSEVLGFHFVIGAFFGALLIDRKFFFASRYSELEKTIGSISSGFLAPIFFAYLGLEFNFTLVSSVLFVGVVLFVSIASKIFAGWLGGRIVKMTNVEALGVGVILNGRGVMELVVAQIALQKKFIGQGLFSTLVIMGVVTTLVTPILFRKWVLPKLQLDMKKESSVT